MKKKVRVYSQLYNIPRGNAGDSLIPGCLVLEGGAFRGLYTSGVLDAFMQNDINLSSTIGISAGALNGFNYVSGDIGRSAYFNLRYRHDSRWVGMKAMQESHSVTGFHFMFNEGAEELPFNSERFYHSGRRFVAVATSLETGEPVYFDNHDPHIRQAVTASASMPFVSAPVMIGGHPYLDGGCKIKIPIDWALAHRFKKIVVITTRDASYRRKPSLGRRTSQLLHSMYRHYPAFVESMENSYRTYNTICDHLDSLCEEGRIFRISPSKPVTVSRLEGDMEKLGTLYRLGYQDALDQMDALRRYLNLSASI